MNREYKIDIRVTEDPLGMHHIFARVTEFVEGRKYGGALLVDSVTDANTHAGLMRASKRAGKQAMDSAL